MKSATAAADPEGRLAVTGAVGVARRPRVSVGNVVVTVLQTRRL